MKKFLNKLFFIFICLFLISSLSLSLYCYISIKNLPTPEIKQVIDKQYSKIYDSNDNLIESLGENKTKQIKYNELPQILINALISIEDNEFFYHEGLNYKRIIKSLINNIFSSSTQGGSTLTQQLVKNLVLNNEKTLKRKIQEAYLAHIIEQNMTKEEILEFYFNSIYFDGMYPGIYYASKKYFAKDVSSLSLPECALLVGLVKSPTYYSPYKHASRCEERKNLVLLTMKNNNYITEEEYNYSIKKIITKEIIEKQNNNFDINYQYQAYLDIVYQEVEELTSLNPFSTPLKIETYLDTSLQSYLDEIQKGNIFKFNDDYQQIASCIIDNNNSSIIGVIGGRNYNGVMLYNRAYNMKRQPASTMKPIFTYALALEYLNYNEYSLIEDKPYTYKNSNITVHNADKKYLGTIPLIDAIGYSRNTSTLYTLENVINKIGQDACIDYLKNINLMDEGPFTMPYAIGGMKYGLSPYLLANAYSLFPNDGVFKKATTIKCIKELDTNKIIYSRDDNSKQILSKETAFIMNSTLQKIMDYNYYNINYSRPNNIIIGGKTGTNAYDNVIIKKYNYPQYADRDSWFVGYSKNYTIACWTGFDEPLINQKTYFGKNDSRRLIVKDIFRTALNKLELKNINFNTCDNISQIKIVKNAPEMYLPNELIPENYIVTASFKKGFEPKQIMPLPEFKKIENVNIISYEDNLQIDVDNELIDDELYKNIFGKRIFLITYEDENNLDTYQISNNHFLIKKHNDKFKLNIVETFENNNKVTGEAFIFYSY